MFFVKEREKMARMIWYAIIAVTVVIFIALHVVILPKRFLRCSYDEKMNDRGVRNVNEEGGHSVVYVPAVQYRRFLKHYALSHRQKGLRLVCDFDKRVEYAEYEVSLYDGQGRVFEVLRVKQAVEQGRTEELRLPAATAYVSVKLINVDGTEFHENHVKGVSGKRGFAFWLACSFIELFALFVIKVCIGKLFGGLYVENFIESFNGTLMTLTAWGAMAVLNGLWTAIYIKSSNGKQTKRNVNDAAV